MNTRPPISRLLCISSSVVNRWAHRPAVACGLLLALSAGAAFSQMTIDKNGNAVNGTPGATVDRRFQQIKPTNVPLTNSTLDAKTRLELIRLLDSEQGFAMRPLPKGHKGLTLEANGKLEPAGEEYLNMVTSAGLSAKPGERVVITDIKFDKNKIAFMLNGGPDAKHRFLRHIQIGAGGGMTSPVVQDDGQEATGARLTLVFKDHVPELTASDVKALLNPLISFDLKTPIQAFTDTLPPELKQAILDHRVLVGMSTEMVLFAMGQPESKTREIEGQMPFEEWIYGKPPKPVQFVRINGNRVIRTEIAKIGEAPQIFDKDVVDGMMRTDGTALSPERAPRTIAMGDTTVDTNRQAAPAPPSLHKEGDAPPVDQQRNPNGLGTMKPVQFPKQKADEYPDASHLPRSPQTADADGAKAPVAPASATAPPSSTGPSAPATLPAKPGPPEPEPDHD